MHQPATARAARVEDVGGKPVSEDPSATRAGALLHLLPKGWISGGQCVEKMNRFLHYSLRRRGLGCEAWIGRVWAMG